MSYNKLQNITLKDTEVHFEHKCNNDTEGFKPNKCRIDTFLHNSLGGVFQYQHKKLNTIISECKAKLSPDFWWEADTNGIESLNDEQRSIFYQYCDKINNLLKS